MTPCNHLLSKCIEQKCSHFVSDLTECIGIFNKVGICLKQNFTFSLRMLITNQGLHCILKKKREEIWRSHMTKNPKQKTMHSQSIQKTLQNVTITDLLRAVSWRDNSHPTDVVNLKFNDQTFPVPATVLQLKGQTVKNIKSRKHDKRTDRQIDCRLTQNVQKSREVLYLRTAFLSLTRNTSTCCYHY